MKKIQADQVAIGMHLSCDVYNAEGVLLWVAGSRVQSEQQLNKLAKEGFFSDLQEWIPAEKPSSEAKEKPEAKRKAIKIKRRYVYKSVVEALLEVQLPLNYILDMFKTDAFHKEARNLTAQINAVVDVILDVCEKHPEESLATINLFSRGRYTILHAVSKSVLTCLICQLHDFSEADRRRYTSAALTANASIAKLMEVLCKQQTGMSEDQSNEYENHPFNSLTLLTRFGVRDEQWLDAVLQHHECLDGSGFPRGLHAKEIVLPARIIAVADAYVTMMLPKQVMQLALDPPSVCKQLYKKRKQLDGSIVAGLVNAFGSVPPGTFVKLRDGTIGVVVSHTGAGERPMVVKVGDDIKKFYTSFHFIGRYKIAEIIRPPHELPKRLFRLWQVYEKKKKRL